MNSGFYYFVSGLENVKYEEGMCVHKCENDYGICLMNKTVINSNRQDKGVWAEKEGANLACSEWQ